MIAKEKQSNFTKVNSIYIYMTHTEKLLSSVALIKTAHTLNKNANNDSAESRQEVMNKMFNNGLLSNLTEHFSPFYGSYVSGKRTALSRALGKEPSSNIEYPLTQSIINMLIGGAGGGAIGAGLGKSKGLGIGAALGSAGGAIYRTLAAQREGANNEKDYVLGKYSNPVKPETYGFLKSLLLPLSGPHRHGEAIAHNQLKGKNEDTTAATILNTLGSLGGVALPVGVGQNFIANNIPDK